MAEKPKILLEHSIFRISVKAFSLIYNQMYPENQIKNDTILN